MKKWRWPLVAIYIAALVLPFIYFFGNRHGFGFLTELSGSALALAIFPLLGLLTFIMVWTQLMVGSTMNPLRKVFPKIDNYHRLGGIFTLIFAVVHPTLLLLGVGLTSYLAKSFVAPELGAFVWLGQIQLLLIITTGGTALLRKVKWLQNKWHVIHLANYIIFASAWVHGWFLGSDVQTSSLKYFWLFFGFTALVSGLAKLQRYIKLRRFIKQQNAAFKSQLAKPSKAG